MGYYTAISVKLKVREGKIEEIRREIERMKRLAQTARGYEWFRYYDDIAVDDDGWIGFSEYYRNICQHEELAEWLAPYVEQGIIECHGDAPRDIWRIYFDGSGNFQRQGMGRALLEAAAAEHGARMAAMEAATNNAGEMIEDLTLYANKVRQAGITKELIEVVSGAVSTE